MNYTAPSWIASIEQNATHTWSIWPRTAANAPKNVTLMSAFFIGEEALPCSARQMK
jgi:hypothetical protein